MSADEISALVEHKKKFSHQKKKNRAAGLSIIWDWFKRVCVCMCGCNAIKTVISNRDRWTTINGTIAIYISVPNTFIILIVS